MNILKSLIYILINTIVLLFNLAIIVITFPIMLPYSVYCVRQERKKAWYNRKHLGA